MSLVTRVALVFIAVVAVSGCATIFHGSSQPVSFDSEPRGARVRVGPFTGTTPFSIVMPKGKDYPIEFSKGGYHRTTTAMQKSFDGIGAINILFWPGFIVDLATGAMFKYDPDRYSVMLEPASQSDQ